MPPHAGVHRKWVTYEAELQVSRFIGSSGSQDPLADRNEATDGTPASRQGCGFSQAPGASQAGRFSLGRFSHSCMTVAACSCNKSGLEADFSGHKGNVLRAQERSKEAENSVLSYYRVTWIGIKSTHPFSGAQDCWFVQG